jgi:hypothetical protein
MQKEIETDLDTDNHPPWLCMHHQHQLYLKAMGNSDTSKPVQLVKNGEIVERESLRAAALFLGMKRNTFNHRVMHGQDCDGWTVRYK